MPFSLGPIGGGTTTKKQDIGVKDNGDRYNSQGKDDSMMQNDVSGLMGHSASGNDLHNDIPPDLAFHEPEPVK